MFQSCRFSKLYILPSRPSYFLGRYKAVNRMWVFDEEQLWGCSRYCSEFWASQLSNLSLGCCVFVWGHAHLLNTFCFSKALLISYFMVMLFIINFAATQTFLESNLSSYLRSSMCAGMCMQRATAASNTANSLQSAWLAQGVNRIATVTERWSPVNQK